MAKTIVCYKWVKVEEDIRINPQDLTVDLSRAKNKISDYDRNAIEAARKLGEATGSEVIGLTYGGKDVRSSLKDALSRGLSQVYWIGDDSADQADGYVTANVLAAAIKKIGDYNLVICAEGAADTYAHQVGPRLGAILDLPVITSVKEITVEDGLMTAVRKLENCLETVTVSLPAVITVLPEISEAPIPGLKSVLEAGKKPQTEIKMADLELGEADIVRRTRVKSLKGYTMTRKNVVFSEGDAREKVAALVSSLKKEGVL